MTTFKGCHSCKQYVKNKPIKWGSKWSCRCSSKTRYHYVFELYLGKNGKTVYVLSKSIVLNGSKKIKNCYCMLFFGSLMPVEKLRIYCIGTALSNRKNMAKMKNDKDMKRGDIEYIQ